MVDKDFAEINALQKVFPESAILLCWYHVLQAVNRWLSKSESGVHGLSNTQKRNEIISFFCKLKACTSVSVICLFHILSLLTPCLKFQTLLQD
uniref:MULE transposase domain-containing protein n=1 Tax=Neolamprologus brichardi TaxID=32507 RepID=A0A3Q4G473_NEOBR